MFKKVGNEMRSPIVLGLLFCVALLAVVLSAQSWLPAYTPYVLLLLCPLMHLFMHGGMHGHGSHSQKSEIEED